MKLKWNILICALFLTVFPLSGYAQLHVSISQGSAISICDGMQRQMTATATGGHAPYHFQWSPSQWLNNDTLANPYCYPPYNLTSDSSVIYTVVVTDSLGTMDTASIFVQVYVVEDLQMSTTAQNYTICSGMSTMLSVNSQFGATYSWTGEGGLFWASGNPVIVSPTTTSSYTVTVNYNGCTSTNQTGITVNNCPYNILQGKVYSDLNANGTRETGEYLMPHVMVNIAPAASVLSYVYDSTYKAFVGTGSYTIIPDNMPYYTQTSNPNVTMGPFTTLVNRDVGIHGQPGISDLEVDIASWAFQNYCDEVCLFNMAWMWPYLDGTQGSFLVHYANVGTIPLSGVLKIKYDSMFENYGTTNPLLNGDTVQAVVGDTLIWQYSNLMPGEERSIYASGLDTNSVLGQVHMMTIIGYPLVSDTVPFNNYDTCYQIVTLAWDPNFKEVSPNTDLNIAQLTEGIPLTYTIHFQNTGTAAAHLVRLCDTLSQNLDLSSFEMISASHPYTLSMLGGNVVEWRFDPIVLPDSGANQLLSNGFVKYRIQPVTTLLENDSITNRAYIYFDSNPAVVTNTVVSHMTLITVGLESTTSIEGFRVYPNPNGGAFSVDIPLSANIVILTNSLGQVLKSILTEGETKLDYEINKSGMYYLQVIIGNQVVTRKVVVLKK